MLNRWNLVSAQFGPPPLVDMKNDPLSAKECAERLKALADEDRLRIVQALRAGPKNVSEIAAELRADITNISHHLQILKREAIVETEKQGRFVVYRLHPDVFAATRSSSECLDLGCCKLELPK
jgi:ArsR family transcriptional regulator, nickel/cobalt-responsive transcriptional repressor